MLVIKHLSGPLAGKEQDISDDRDHVLIGRDSAKCEILYPAEETIVGGEHCQFLRQPSGDWVIERFGDHYVEIDGVAVETRQPLRTGSEIRLGKHSGPSFQVTVTRAPRDGLQRNSPSTGDNSGQTIASPRCRSRPRFACLDRSSDRQLAIY